MRYVAIVRSWLARERGLRFLLFYWLPFMTLLVVLAQFDLPWLENAAWIALVVMFWVVTSPLFWALVIVILLLLWPSDETCS